MSELVIRKSGYNDYIAVNLTDGEKILSTPLYLAKDKPVLVKGFDYEEKKWLKIELLFNGEKIIGKDVDLSSDWHGLEYYVELDDLLDNNQYKYNV